MKQLLVICALVMCLAGLASPAPATLITFDEFPLGTMIDNQYAAQGVVFLPGIVTPRLPQISMNGAMPTQPVLRPTGEPDFYIFQGDFFVQFPTPAYTVDFISGYWDYVGVAVIDVYDPSDNLIASLTNTTTGVDTTSIWGMGPIGKIYYNSIADGAGADMDNLAFDLVPPTPTPTATATSTPTSTPTNTPKRPDGATCTGPDDCLSGYCVDGVCCDTACEGALVQCNVAGRKGVCTEITASAPAASSTGLLITVLALVAIGVLAIGRRSELKHYLWSL